MADDRGFGDFQEHRAYLYRYALLQVRDANRADDVVQETLLAAIESGESYAGRSGSPPRLAGTLASAGSPESL